MMRRYLWLAMLCAFLAPVTAACSVVKGPKPQEVDDVWRPAPAGVSVTDWVTGLEVPWDLLFLDDRTALVTERPGRIRKIVAGTLQADPYAEPAVAGGGEGGLMGLARHPEFPDKPYIYIMYTHRSGGGRFNRVDRYRHQGDKGVFDRIILDEIPGGRFHDGGRIAFGPDGLLYIATGETFDRELAQQRDSLGGKILRVTPEGKIPEETPFTDSPIYTLGHRNPQGLAWDPETGALFASEHGPSGEVGFGAHDEINLIRGGGNYGWPKVVCAPGKAAYVDPILCWPDRTTPPAGMAFHDGDLFVATLGSEALLRIGLRREERKYRVTAVERWFKERGGESRYGRLRDVVKGPDGALYILTSNRDGRGRPRAGDDRILRMTFDRE